MRAFFAHMQSAGVQPRVCLHGASKLAGHLVPGRLHLPPDVTVSPSAAATQALHPLSSSASPDADNDKMRFQYEPPIRKLSFRTWHKRRALALGDEVKPQIDIMVEGMPLRGKMNQQEQTRLLQSLGVDAGMVVKRALNLRAARQPNYKPPRVASLSLVMCDDARMSVLNAQHRGKEGPTDVLSFEMDDELDYKVRLPMKLLGDMVISLDTAQRQAKERGHSLRDEVRILLVHGMLHLCGMDHEKGHQELLEMAAAEQQLMQELGWVGQGLISSVGADQGDAEAVELHKLPKGKGFGAAGSTIKVPRKKEAAAAVSREPLSEPAGSVGASPWRRRHTGGAAAAAEADAGGSGASGGTLGVLGSVFGSMGDHTPGPSTNNNASADNENTPSSNNGANAGTASASTSESSSSTTDALDRRPTSGQAAQPGTHQGSSALTEVAGAAAPKAGGRIAPQAGRAPGGVTSPRIQLVALDMDGTLLDGRSKVRPSSVDAIQRALNRGVTVMLATGKARPAAICACEAVGLAGPGLLVHSGGPGIFLQGLAVHGRAGQQLIDAQLPADVVARAFQYVSEAHPDGAVSLVAFTGDHCSTLRMTDDLQALHDVYYEPLAVVEPSLDAILAGPPVRKLLFMTSAKVVDGVLIPHWTAALQGSGAAHMQAVPNMLEVVPLGVDKWVGAQVLLKHLDVQPEHFMAVGDGSNDLQLVKHAGWGVAMGNAVPSVKAAAKAVVASNNEDGIAEAFERFVF